MHPLSAEFGCEGAGRIRHHCGTLLPHPVCLGLGDLNVPQGDLSVALQEEFVYDPLQALRARRRGPEPPRTDELLAAFQHVAPVRDEAGRKGRIGVKGRLKGAISESEAEGSDQ